MTGKGEPWHTKEEESATRQLLLFQQSAFMTRHSVDIVSYFHSVWVSVKRAPKELTRPGRTLMFSSARYPVYYPRCFER